MMDVLDKTRIKNAFPDIDMYLLDTIDSTNVFLKNLNSKNPIALCISEMQTHGRGRFGRQWDSPSGLNIYMSLSLAFDEPLIKLSGLSLAMGLSVYQVLKIIMPKVAFKLKWPNDIYVHHNKIAGILIEIQPDHHQHHVIIGLGLNVNEINMPQGRTSLRAESGSIIDRTALLIDIIEKIQTDWQMFKREGFKPLISNWNQADMLTGKSIHITNNQKPLYGKALGVNEDGHLLLLDDKGFIHTIHAGVASLSRTDGIIND